MWGLAAEMIACWQRCHEEKKKADLAAMHNHLGDNRRLFETEKNERKKRMAIFNTDDMSASVLTAHWKKCMAPGAINVWPPGSFNYPFLVNPAEMWHAMEDNTLTVEKMRAAVRVLKENNYKPNFQAIARERAQWYDDEIVRSYLKGKPMGSNVNTHSSSISLGVKRHSATRITVDGYKDNRSGNSIGAGHPKEPVVVIGRDNTGSTIAIPAEQIEVVVAMLREAANFANDQTNAVKQFAAQVGIVPNDASNTVGSRY